MPATCLRRGHDVNCWYRRARARRYAGPSGGGGAPVALRAGEGLAVERNAVVAPRRGSLLEDLCADFIALGLVTAEMGRDGVGACGGGQASAAGAAVGRHRFGRQLRAAGAPQVRVRTTAVASVRGTVRGERNGCGAKARRLHRMVCRCILLHSASCWPAAAGGLRDRPPRSRALAPGGLLVDVQSSPRLRVD